jgi:hypothetical protein
LDGLVGVEDNGSVAVGVPVFGFVCGHGHGRAGRSEAGESANIQSVLEELMRPRIAYLCRSPVAEPMLVHRTMDATTKPTVSQSRGLRTKCSSLRDGGIRACAALQEKPFPTSVRASECAWCGLSSSPRACDSRTEMLRSRRESVSLRCRLGTRSKGGGSGGGDSIVLAARLCGFLVVGGE